MSLQGGYTDFKQIFLLSVSIQAHILWYPGPYNWLLFYFYEWYSKHNIVTRDSLTPDSFIMQNFYYLLWDFFFFVTLHCFSGCKHYCVTLGCVNSSSCSLPFVQRASTRTACWKSAKILLWELDTSWKTPAFLLWGGGSAQHPRSLQALFPSPNVLFGTGHVPPPTLEQCLLHFIETINRISYKG